MTLRSEPPPGGVHLSERLITHGAVTMEHIVEGGLTEVAEAARTELDKYLTMIAV
ncbi:hypothetical protein [Streptomyces swartbergensis]|uniref:hypothetical protein n=1 Tax=Streptomyces swartbergensis TaxID=487165 RepID=UPI003822FA3D